MMKIVIVALALAATAFGVPVEEAKRGACTPPQYACTADATGWQVCDVSGNFVVSKLDAS
jgi:hypothetical protein